MSGSEPHPFQGSLRKIDRAITHLHELQEEVRSFLDAEPDPLRAVTKVDVETSRYLMRVRIDRPFPDWWGLIVGDLVQNLRAALDHLVCRCLWADGKEPTTRNAFSIFDHAPSSGQPKRRWKAMVDGLNPEAITFIENAQPYQGPSGPKAHTLHALRELSNEDKHRLLLPAVAAVRKPETPEGVAVEVVESRDVGPIEGGTLYSGYALQDGDLVLEAPVTITGPNPEVQTNANFEFDIGFGRDPIVPSKGMLQMLDSVRATVQVAARELGGFSGPLV